MTDVLEFESQPSVLMISLQYLATYYIAYPSLLIPTLYLHIFASSFNPHSSSQHAQTNLVAGLTLLACVCALVPEEELGDNPLPEKKVDKRGLVGVGYGYRVFSTPDSVSHVSFNTARYIPTPTVAAVQSVPVQTTVIRPVAVTQAVYSPLTDLVTGLSGSHCHGKQGYQQQGYQLHTYTFNKRLLALLLVALAAMTVRATESGDQISKRSIYSLGYGGYGPYYGGYGPYYGGYGPSSSYYSLDSGYNALGGYGYVGGYGNPYGHIGGYRGHGGYAW
uniref:Uncharacterized protein n=1 Tax=Timema monikensis TaxID=170555 RepID=A0A7R9ELC2_9NEOP|nr:unnamed protein product [Timema monikensis]